MGTYVILQPNSNTNPTSQFRVVWDEDWAKYVNGAVPMLALAGSYATYEEAEEQRDKLNEQEDK